MTEMSAEELSKYDGRGSDTLVATVEKCRILEEKLKTAIKDIKWIEEQADTSYQYDYDAEVILKNILATCQETLKKIKE